MRRISIDVTDAQHRTLKAMAALHGQSVKDFVLERTIGDRAPDTDVADLERLLDERIERSATDGARSRSVSEVFEQARRAADPPPDEGLRTRARRRT